MLQEFFRLRGQVQKLENFSSQTFISVHSHSLRLNCERGVGRGGEEEMKKESEKEKEWGSEAALQEFAFPFSGSQPS